MIVENLQPVTMAIASTHPSPGSGAMFAGRYINIPKAIRKMLINKNNTENKIVLSNGTNETKYKAKSVK